MSWTEAQLSEHQAKRAIQVAPAPVAQAGPKYKSKAEARYAAQLEIEKRAGLISDWGYEEVTLVVGKGGDRISRFTPDFSIHHNDRSLELREVKGYMKDDARAKLLAAVKQWPSFRWTLVWAKRMSFEVERLN